MKYLPVLLGQLFKELGVNEDFAVFLRRQEVAWQAISQSG